MRRATWSALVAALVLTAAITAHWKLRILDTGEAQVTRASVDTYYEHIPMVEYGFGRLAQGDLPLWNPHQLCGIPSLAIPHVGQLYPGNLPYLFLDAGTATEVVFLLHQLLAAMSLWLLLRAHAISPIGSCAGAVTYIWATWLITCVKWPSIHGGLSWAPATLLAIELTMRRHRAGVFVLALAVACQLLNGAHEVFVHSMLAGGLFSLMRLGNQARLESWRAAFGSAGLLLAGVACGVALAAIQLLPTFELVQESARSGGSPPGINAVVPPATFVANLLTSQAYVAVGVLPLLVPALGFAAPRARLLWLFAIALGFLSAELAFGGQLYALYESTPIGRMFRRPFKFLGLFDLAAALGAGIAIGGLESLGRSPGRSVARRWAWQASVALVAALLLIERSQLSDAHVPLAAMLALLVLFALAWSRATRTVVLVALLFLQGHVLFTGFENADLRPVQRDDLLDRHRPLLERYADWSEGRVLLHPSTGFHPDLMAKQAMRVGFYSISDYQALAPARHRDFFRAAGGATGRAKRAYSGFPELTDQAVVSLLDLASTRHYLVKFNTPEEVFVRSHLADGEFVERHGRVRPSWKELLAYERPWALPRAYFVPRARQLSSPRKVLDELQSDRFDPYREVLVEESSQVGSNAAASPAQQGQGEEDEGLPPGGFLGLARIQQYESELVTIEVESGEPGYLVLTDSYYAGWRATANGIDAPILRANYLFRAVPVDSGTTTVVFEYRPRSVLVGAIISGTAATGLFVVAAFMWRRRHY